APPTLMHRRRVVEVLVARGLWLPPHAVLVNRFASCRYLAVAKQRFVESRNGYERRVERRCVHVGFGDCDVDAHGPTTSVDDAAEEHHRCEDGVRGRDVLRESDDQAQENARLGRLRSEAGTEGPLIADELGVPAVDLGLLEVSS